MLRFVKENKVFFIFTFIALFVYVAYINRSTANIIFQDQFDFLGFLEKFYNGNLNFGDLWQSHMEHRTLGYNILFLLNAILFNLNTTYEMYLGAIILLVTTVIIFIKYRDSLKSIGNFSDNKISITFLPIIMVIFGLTQWENIVFGLGMSIFLRMLIFIITFIVFDRMIFHKKKLTFILFLTMSILLFGAGYSPAIVLSMLFVLVLKTFIDGKRDIRENIKYIFLTIFTSIILFFIYFYNIYENNMVENATPISEKIVFVFSNMFMAIKFLLLSFASSIIGVNFTNVYLNEYIILLLGIFVLLTYISAFLLFFKSQMFKKTYTPLLIMIYSIIIYGLIIVGRLDYGVTYGMSSRYVTDTQYGLIASIWIIVFYYFSNINIQKYKKLLILFATLMICLSQLITFITEWGIGPYRKMNFLELRDIAINNQLYEEDEFEKFQYPNKIVKDGLHFLKENNLNVYSDYDIDHGGSNLENAIFINGWYQKENNGDRWVNKLSIARFRSGEKGSLIINGYVPENYSDNIHVKLYINSNLLKTQDLKTGLFSINLTVEKNSNIELKIETDKSFVPKEMGINEDTRELSLLINSIELK